jgi:hypothetical protein
MNSEQLIENVRCCFKTRRPVLIFGPAGVGKSSIVYQIADMDKYDGVCDVRGSTIDPVDLRGYPEVKDGKVRWLNALWPTSGKWIIFLDELGNSFPQTQNGLLQLALDLRIGDYVVPPACRIIGATNRLEDRAHLHKISEPLLTRFIKFNLDVDVEKWTKWALAHSVMIETIAFIQFRSALLFTFDPHRDDAGKYGNPRAWEMVSDFMKTNPPKDTEHEALTGIVGEGNATEFLGFMKVFRSLPNIDALIMNPSASPLPDRKEISVHYAISAALARKASPQNFGNISTYLSRLRDAQLAEFAVLTVHGAISQHPEIQNTRTYIQWTSDNHDLMN